MSTGDTAVSQPADASVPWGDRTVWVVLASTALAPLGVPLLSPTLPVFRDHFGLSDPQAALLVSGYFVVGILLSPFIGLLADRVGRKHVLVGGLLGFGVLGGAMAAAPSFEVVLVLRVVQGTAAAAIFITTVTIVSESFEGAQRMAVLGINVAVLSAGAALYPVLGGTLATIAWNVPFLAYLGALPVALFAAFTLAEPRRAAGARGLSYLSNAARAVVTPSTLALLGATLLTEFLGFGVLFTALPFLLGSSLSPVLIGVVLFGAELASMLAAAAAGRLSLSIAVDRLIAVGFACYGLGFLLIWVAPGPLVVAAGAVVAGAGVGLLLPSIDAVLSERVPADYRAGTFSLRNSTTFLGRTTGPLAFAGLAVTAGYGYAPLLFAAGVLALLTAGFTVVVTR
ncbi:MAG: MFS transporter [Halapricum sp.]